MELDEINLAIINHLRDGRMPYKKIADSLGLSEGTIRARVKRLREEGILDITALIDPDAMPDQSIVMVGVNLKDMDLVKKGEEFSKLRGVISVCVVTGRFDLILTVLLTKDFNIALVSFLAFIPVFLLVVAIQKHLSRGLTMGAVKG
ncbi:MAG: transcriptional regulator [Desulfotalea sp.]|nr:MAG: transcriptional regulator [Desulfotalea sp.]